MKHIIQEFIKTHTFVVLDFWAEWCAPCRKVGLVIEELSKEFSGKVTFGKCNTDDNRLLAMKFNITAIPSIMLFSHGQLVDRIIGVYPKEAIREKIIRKFNPDKARNVEIGIRIQEIEKEYTAKKNWGRAAEEFNKLFELKPDAETSQEIYFQLAKIYFRLKDDGKVIDNLEKALFHGDKGTLKASVYSFDFIPMSKGEPLHPDVAYELDQYPEEKTDEDLEQHCAPALRRHMVDFLAAIDARTKPVADIEEGHISAACCILANLALKTGRTLVWDPVSHEVKGDDEANRLLRRPYRRPWIHPEAGSV